ncbi:OLC1v1015861C3 [Oldenlandia corymbosa var. corymbosa]|uniref:Carboxymethylenebutenolidase homolog n=1 Tax=Oldenlandia corymbosa var. corymbosa TaxID=529605 RepID=A0AAV1E457_OLDCO|nr:OLC1v1015861C3 [Oldenlandia corymbosa var. corymbosa]
MGWSISSCSTPLMLSSHPKIQCSSNCFFQTISLQGFSGFASAAPIKSGSCRISCWRSFLVSKKRKQKRRTLAVASQLKVVDAVEDDEACELVNGVEVLIGGEGDYEIYAYLLKPVKNNNGTGILLLSDVFGFEDSATRDFAYRVACNGYNVLVPDLFRGDPWTKDKPKSLYEEWRARHSQERVANDIFASTNWMINEFLAAGISKKLGIIGFCFGGGRVIDILAQDQGGCFGVGVSFYGTRINTSLATNVKVPVLFIAGDNDPLCPINTLKDAEKQIEQSKVVVFEGRGHAFAHRPESPEEDEDAETAFVLMRNWLHDGLDTEP